MKFQGRTLRVPLFLIATPPLSVVRQHHILQAPIGLLKKASTNIKMRSGPHTNNVVVESSAPDPFGQHLLL